MNIIGTLKLDLNEWYADFDHNWKPAFIEHEKEGLYLPFKDEPSIVPGKQYFYIAKNRQITPIADYREIPKMTVDILDKDLEVVLNGRRLRTLQPEPHPYSLTARKVIEDYVGHLLRVHGVWCGSPEKQAEHHRSPMYNTQYVVECMLKEEYLYPKNPTTGEEGSNAELVQAIEARLFDLRQVITEYLGSNRWQTHYLKLTGSTLTIEKGIDWRIQVFMQERGFWDN